MDSDKKSKWGCHSSQSVKHSETVENWQVHATQYEIMVHEPVLLIQGLVQNPQCGPQGD